MKKEKDTRMRATIKVQRANGKWEKVFDEKVEDFKDFFDKLHKKNEQDEAANRRTESDSLQQKDV